MASWTIIDDVPEARVAANNSLSTSMLYQNIHDGHDDAMIPYATSGKSPDIVRAWDNTNISEVNRGLGEQFT